jgi:hypothetical protein
MVVLGRSTCPTVSVWHRALLWVYQYRWAASRLRFWGAWPTATVFMRH